jgi:hypothetical protein
MKFICFNIRPAFLSNFCMHYVSDLFTDTWWISYIWHANRVTLDPNGWVEGATDVHEELGANSSAQCIGHCAQHMPLPSSAQNIGPLFQNGEFCMHYYQTSGKVFPKFIYTCIGPHTQLSGVLSSVAMVATDIFQINWFSVRNKIGKIAQIFVKTEDPENRGVI